MLIKNINKKTLTEKKKKKEAILELSLNRRLSGGQ